VRREHATHLENGVVGQHKHLTCKWPVAGSAVPTAERGKFFNSSRDGDQSPTISDLIIPPMSIHRRQAAGVTDFIDLMVSESSNETRALWREGLAAVDRMSEQSFPRLSIRPVRNTRYHCSKPSAERAKAEDDRRTLVCGY